MVQYNKTDFKTKKIEKMNQPAIPQTTHLSLELVENGTSVQQWAIARSSFIQNPNTTIGFESIDSYKDGHPARFTLKDGMLIAPQVIDTPLPVNLFSKDKIEFRLYIETNEDPSMPTRYYWKTNCIGVVFNVIEKKADLINGFTLMREILSASTSESLLEDFERGFTLFRKSSGLWVFKT